MGLQLVESGETIPGALDSHETEPGPGNRPHPLLLSQAVQARLGLTKSSRYGKVTLDDYNGQSLEVARELGTGLFMIRIDHLSPEQYRHLPIRDLLSEEPDWSERWISCPLDGTIEGRKMISSAEETDEEEQDAEEAMDDAEKHCYVSREYKPQAPRRLFLLLCWKRIQELLLAV